MITLMIMEYEHSAPQYREMPMHAAYAMASSGAYFKAQIISEFGVIDYEF